MSPTPIIGSDRTARAGPRRPGDRIIESDPGLSPGPGNALSRGSHGPRAAANGTGTPGRSRIPRGPPGNLSHLSRGGGQCQPQCVVISATVRVV
eukprot:337063-Hanusia_phi.AAC.1